ncbi:MAG TPA: fumarylacetoacetate hydrolase family protein [Bacillales bacterium]|nr:fumarylacetoacetate hydrolase family protein [Bacillales bacterium]
MKFVTFSAGETETLRPGVLDEDGRILDVQQAERQMIGDVTVPGELLMWMEGGETVLDNVRNVVEWARDHQDQSFFYERKAVRLAAPIPRPRKNVFCVGKNYADHAKELNKDEELPQHPIVFSKPPTTVSNPNSPVPLHNQVTDFLDYEGELAVVIGKTGRGIAKENAYDHIFGYTIINDLSARDIQQRHKQYLLGKSLDGSCPLGPWIVCKEEVGDPHDLHIETKVNGEVRQSADTRLMIFDIPTLLSVISAGMTLEAGDIIATGTPAGVGKGLNPPKPLQDGDVVEVTVSGIGTLTNTVSRT